MNTGVLILDFGSQYTQLIARRIRELHVYSEIVPFHMPIDEIRNRHPGALILSGGPSSVYAPGAPRIDPQVLELGIPVLGICYGLQLMALMSGIKVEGARNREYGLAELSHTGNSLLMKDVSSPTTVWMSHGDKIAEFPTGFTVAGRTTSTETAILEMPQKDWYGVQFHPEVVHTTEGKKILANFVFTISRLSADWTMDNFVQTTIYKLRKKIGRERILLGLSGGVDSTVLALLLHKAVADQVTPVFVDTGLLRKNEFNEMMDHFKNSLQIKVFGVNAADTFLSKLKNIKSPERKRKIIGRTFIDVFEDVHNQLGPFQYFAQGTLYPDVIESISVRGPSATIKSHHNVGGLPKKLKWKLIEPLRELFKDEVRELGKELGLAPHLIYRHPFPGPGLAVRIIGNVTQEKVEQLQEADAILIHELRESGLYEKVWQAFAVLLPVKSVGVMGDERTYENVVVLRMVESVDGMTADWFPAPYEFLKKTANRIVNEVKGINRVTYDLTSKPPGTIEWE